MAIQSSQRTDHNAKNSIGLDFGPESARETLVEIQTGKTVWTAVFPYPPWSAGSISAIPLPVDWARHSRLRANTKK